MQLRHGWTWTSCDKIPTLEHLMSFKTRRSKLSYQNKVFMYILRIGLTTTTKSRIWKLGFYFLSSGLCLYVICIFQMLFKFSNNLCVHTSKLGNEIFYDSKKTPKKQNPFFLNSDGRSSMYDVLYVQYVLANLFKCNAVKVLVSTYFFLKLDKRPADCLNFKNESRYSM